MRNFDFLHSYFKRGLSVQSLNFVAACVLASFYNLTFFRKVYAVYSEQTNSILHLFSVYLLLIAVIYFLLILIATGPWQKYILGILFLLASGIAYFSEEYGVIIDRTMILNIFHTDLHETMDLFTFKMAAYLFVLGLLPIYMILKAKVPRFHFQSEFKSAIKSLVLSLIFILFSVLVLNKFYVSFFRENKPLRFYTNPAYPIYSALSFLIEESETSDVVAAEIGKGTHISVHDKSRDLVIFVLGETARAQNFSLNGYAKETNPLLKKENVISFSNLYSCGTSTATSVPCLFSIFGREAYTHEKSINTQNLVDVLYHTNDVDVLWRDNNSDSKGVAVRVPYETFRYKKYNKVCDEECRDIGMLDGLQDYIHNSKKKDIFIVLHQMGNHGPAYYKRYPKEFEKFKPVCQSAELDSCTQEEIVNAYDNALLYTDYFLSKVIELLKKNEPQFNTTMFYVSDHGESLGERGIYLHGLPYSIATDEQKKVGAIFWFGETTRKELDVKLIASRARNVYSHDNIFHTVLGLFEMESSLYDKSKDLFH